MYQMVYDWTRYTTISFAKSLHKLNVGKTLELRKSLGNYHVQGNVDDVEKVVWEFLKYGRFRDMGVGKGQRLGDVKGNQTIYRETGVKGRVPKKWYSKTIYGESNKLAQLLNQHYSKNITSEIKESLPDSINISL